VYRDPTGKVFHSVTHILKETADNDALERWKARMGDRAGVLSSVATTRGTRAHSRVEWRLKTARKLALAALAKSTGATTDALLCERSSRIPSSIWTWALNKAYQSKPPKLDLSSVAYGRCLDEWLESNCSGEAAVELRINCTPQNFTSAYCDGWAGTFDAALYLRDRPGLWLVDWKTSANRRGADMLSDYFDQLGAYNAGVLQHNPRLEGFAGGAVVIARRAGPPDVHWLERDELLARTGSFAARFKRYTEALEAGTEQV
jgi:hypothetical protein